MKAWHFLDVNAAGEPVLRDGRKLVLGEWLEHEGDLVMCEQGFHASVRAIDALSYAPGVYVTIVECEGVVEGEDKLVCRRRRAIAGGNASEALLYFARWCALSCLDNWQDQPQAVLDWLMTGDEQYRSAAESAAESAAWGAAAESAARSAARSAAWSAAARSAAARSAAVSAAAWSAAASASAAWSAAWSAAAWGAAAWGAAWSAAWSAANEDLERLLTEGVR